MPDAFIPQLAQTRVLTSARIRRERLLPSRGTVLASIGSRVGALDVVARTEALENSIVVPLATILREPANRLPEFLRKQPGESFRHDEILAAVPQTIGRRRLYRAPGAGRLIALRGAWLALELVQPPFELRALYRGQVINVIPQMGVVIEATGALAQGVWGIGGECFGLLKKMVNAPGEMLSERKIDAAVRGAIVVAGGVTDAALHRLAQERCAGLIVGGLESRALVEQLKLPVLMTEGWGTRAIASPIFDLLAAHDGAEAILNAPGTMRPDVFIPSIGASAPAPALVAQIDARVRVIGGAYRGEIGEIVAIPILPRTAESGIQIWGAEVDLASSKGVHIAWDNLEIIG